MEIIRYPSSLATSTERVAVVTDALRTLRSTGSNAESIVCWVHQVTHSLRETSEKKMFHMFQMISRELHAATSAFDAAIVTKIGFEFVLDEPSDLFCLLRMRGALRSVDCVMITLGDPSLLEGGAPSFVDLVDPHQLLLINVTSTLRAEKTVSPEAFALPQKKLPKGNVALFSSYSEWLSTMDTQGATQGAAQLRSNFSKLQHHIIVTTKIPLLTGFGGDWSTNLNRRLMLRSLRDVYALQCVLRCGVSGVRQSDYNEAVAMVRRVLGKNGGPLALCRAQRSADVTKHLAHGKVADDPPAKITSRPREDDGLDFFEDAPSLKIRRSEK